MKSFPDATTRARYTLFWLKNINKLVRTLNSSSRIVIVENMAELDNTCTVQVKEEKLSDNSPEKEIIGTLKRPLQDDTKIEDEALIKRVKTEQQEDEVCSTCNNYSSRSRKKYSKGVIFKELFWKYYCRVMCGARTLWLEPSTCSVNIPCSTAIYM